VDRIRRKGIAYRILAEKPLEKWQTWKTEENL
jgi:hypothetical protein